MKSAGRSSLTLLFSFVVSLITLSPNGFANDSIFAFGAGGIEFKKTDDISMEKEVLTISDHKVRVEYVFLNTTTHPVKEKIVFPMPPLVLGCDRLIRSYDGNLQDFKLWVNDQRVETSRTLRAVLPSGEDVTNRLRKLGLSDNSIVNYNGYSPCEADWEPLDKDAEIVLKKLIQNGLVVGDKSPRPLWLASYVEYWNQEFPPKSIIKVVHEYVPLIGTDSGNIDFKEAGFGIKTTKELAARFYNYNLCITDGTLKAAMKTQQGSGGLRHNIVEYILATGANWAGPIKDFTLNLKKQKEDDVVSLCFDGHFKKTNPLTLTSHLKNFVPKKDLQILFLYRDANTAK